MDKNFVDIINNLFKYLELKRECIDKHYENLWDVIRIFTQEVGELKNVSIDLCTFIDAGKQQTNLTDNQIALEVIRHEEENLLNELADVLLTASRLVYEFNLQEALSEMIEYKYERQKSRELKRFENTKNELLK